MVKEKSTEKKSPTKFMGGNYSGTLEGDPVSFYRDWKKAVENFSGELGMTSSESLLDALMGHGTVGRNNKGPKVMTSVANVIKELDAFMDSAMLDNSDITVYESLIQELKTVEKQDNPRNIPFRVVEEFSIRTEKVRSKKQYYGHYLTPQYRKYRKEVKDQALPEIPTHYYNTSKNKAKPPMWQALFGTGNLEFKNIGLLTVLEKTLDAIKNTSIELDKSKPIAITDKKRVGGKSAGVALYDEVPKFKQFIDNMVKQANAGTGYITRGKKLSTQTPQTQLKNIKIEAEDVRDSQLVKRLMEKGELIPQQIKSFYINISRRQIENACIHAKLDTKKVGLSYFKKAEEVEIKNWEQLLKVA